MTAVRLPRMALLVLGFAWLSGARAEAAPPNVVVILLDDLGWGDVGFHGSTESLTPHIDALVAKGSELRHFYGHPDGFQTRAALLTGRYPLRYGLQGVVARSRDETGLPKREVTLPQILKDEGYGTFLVGTWGLGTDEDYRPLDRGFDHHYGPLGDAVDQYSHGDMKNKLDWYRDGALSYDEGYSADLLVAEAIKVLDDNHAAGPLYLQLSLTTPHKPYQAPQAYLKRHEFTIDPKPERRIYAAALTATDDAIGRFLAEIDKLGLTNDTVVFFLSDNGGDAKNGMAHNTPLRGSAGNDQTERLYDGAMRVPAAMIWEGEIQPGVDERPLVAPDIFSTVLGFVGVEPETNVDGEDLRKLSVSEADARTLALQVSKRTVVIRRGPWKFIAKRDETSTTSSSMTFAEIMMLEDLATWTPTATELYDVSKDPGETVNLADANKEMVDSMSIEARNLLTSAVPPGVPNMMSREGSSSGPPSGADASTTSSGASAAPSGPPG
jgi:arylsulfatase A-like enzyme